MLEFIKDAILWTLAIYGFFEIIKTIIYEKVYSIDKIKEGTNIIITVKNGEEYIEGFIRNILFKIIYGEEKFIKDIFIVDLNSTDKTNDILEKLEEDYDCIKNVDVEDCNKILEHLNT